MSTLLEKQVKSWEKAMKKPEGEIVDWVVETKVKNTLNQARQRRSKRQKNATGTRIYLAVERGKELSPLARRVTELAGFWLLQEGFPELHFKQEQSDGFIYSTVHIAKLWPIGYKKRDSARRKSR